MVTLRPTLATAAMTCRAAHATVVAAEAAAAARQHPADAAAAHRVGEPRRADLALAAGEAADAGDVRARLDDRGRGARLAGDGDRAAAVRLGVGDGRRQPGAVAAEAAAAHAAAGAPPAPRAPRRRRSAPPAPWAARPGPAGAGRAPKPPPRPPRRGRRPAAGPPPKPACAGPPAGNVPVVAWPSVCTAQLAGASSSSAERGREHGAAQRSARAATSATAVTAPATSRTVGSHVELAGVVVEHERARSPRRRQRQRPRPMPAARRRAANQPDAGADERGREGRQLRDVVGMEDPLGEAEGDGGREERPADGDQPAGAGVGAPQARGDREARRWRRRAKPSSQPACPPRPSLNRRSGPGGAAEGRAAARTATAAGDLRAAGLAVEAAEAVVAEDQATRCCCRSCPRSTGGSTPA